MKLISFKTIVENQKENKIALKWARNQLKNLPLYFEEFSSSGFSSLVITTQKTKNPKIWLASHIDVAKADDKMFIPIIKGNKLYGRGAFDMKFAIACYIKLLKELKADLSKLDFGLIITSDEEAGGENGIKFLLDKGYVSQAAFLPDGGDDWKIEDASKGVWCFVIKSYGNSCHPSTPWRAVNALEELLDFLQILRNKFKKEPCGDPSHMHSTIDINELNTGKTGDVLPGYAEGMVDIFFISEKERKMIEAYMKAEIKKFKGLKTEIIFLKPCFKVNTDNQFINLFSRIALEKYGIKKEAIFNHGTSDAVFFAKKNIPVIETRPKGGGHHSNNEWIDLKDLEKFYEVMKEFVQRGVAI